MVIKDGILKGFVSVNPRWSGFKSNDYREASNRITENAVAGTSLEIVPKSGDFDLRGYEVARSQFFEIGKRICLSFTINTLSFSMEALGKLDTQYIELLVHPQKRFFAVRPCQKEMKNALRWVKFTGDKKLPKKIYGTAFIPNLYDLFGWNHAYRYRVTGFRRQKDSESVILFDLEDTEALIPKSVIENPDDENTQQKKGSLNADTAVGIGSHILGFPGDWGERFGTDYYRQAQILELAQFDTQGIWDAGREGEPIKTGEVLNVTSPAALGQQIEQLISQMKRKDE